LHRDPEKKGRERCESDFERNVFDRLHAAGYRVTPQVPSGGYRIDLVVEGHSGRRLAIECDGDQYHSPEVWLEDLHRQRTLERAGWTFWRCWGSSFIRDPDACMTDVISALERVGVEPVGASEVDLSEVVEYREIGGSSIEDQPAPPLPSKSDSGEKIAISTPSQPAPDKPVHSGLPAQTTAQSRTSVARSKQQVEIGDSVRYCFVDAPDEDAFVTIVESASNPNLGMINMETVVARVLLGMEVGQEREVPLLAGRRKIRVKELHKPNRGKDKRS